MNNGIESINIIYHDENLNYEGNGIIEDSQAIQQKTKCTLILTSNLKILNLLLGFISRKKNMEKKFVLLVNGRSAQNTINFIENSSFKSLFINACIYTSNKNNYLEIQKKYPNFVKDICINCKEIINFLINASKIMKEKEKFNINTLINFDSYKNEYFQLHKKLSLYYGDNSKGTFTSFFKNIKDFIKKEESNKNELINCFNSFNLLLNENYTQIIKEYIKHDNFSRYLNKLLMEKDPKIYNNIAYFVGNLMNCIVEYGKNEKKGIDHGKIFYKGLQLNIVEVLEFLKNINLLITFPYFLTMTTKINYAELSSKRKNNKKDNNLFSVIMKIEYLHDEGYEPSAFDLSDLSQYPDEEDYYLLPFTFLYLKNIAFDLENLNADINLEIIGKSEVLEKEIKKGHKIEFNNNEHIIYATE